jgi:YHS domain-containing protein
MLTLNKTHYKFHIKIKIHYFQSEEWAETFQPIFFLKKEVGLYHHVVCPHFNFWTNWPIVSKFSMNVTSLEVTPTSYVLISYSQ